MTAHSIAGSFIYGVFAVKVFFVHDRAHPRWTLPLVGGTLFATLATLWVTSAYWYFTEVGSASEASAGYTALPAGA